MGLYCTLCVLVQGMQEIKRPLCPAHNSIQCLSGLVEVVTNPLMLQNSGDHHPERIKPRKNHGINYQPQLVQDF